MKVIFPCVWIPGFGFAALFLVADANSARASDIWALPWLWVIGSSLLIWFTRRLKTVRIHGDTLHIKNYIREISTPISNIADVNEIAWINPPTIKIEFNTPIEFGSAIYFIPTHRIAFWGAHPIMEELKVLAKLRA